MLDPQKLPPEQKTSREQEFTSRYDKLLSWALRLTNHQRASAEDLVQDAFIQFTRGRTSLDSIENLDGYLHRMLRNMHLSRVRRCAQQVQNTTLSVAESGIHLDSHESELQQRMQAHEQLCRICQYACLRKESSRAGSVLILRFFHEYSPSEIAEVLCCSRHCVDQWQRFARREVKLYLEDPRRLKFVTANGPISLPQIRVFGDNSLADNLRLLIFHSRQGECLSAEELRQAYALGGVEGLSTSNLGHIVSCRVCLDEVNRIIGLPLLKHRYHLETHSSKTPPTASGGGGGSDEGPTDLNVKFRRRLRDVINHKPKELHIAINGAPFGSVKIASEVSELDLNLSPDEPIDFIDILSEEGIQLLFFNVSQQQLFVTEQWAQIRLSEGRILEARLCLADGLPTLRISYNQTADLAEDCPAPGDAGDITDARSFLCDNRTELIVASKPGTNVRMFADLLNRGSLAPTGEITAVPDSAVRNRVGSVLSGFVRVAAGLIRSPSWTKPQLITVIAAVVIIGGVVFLKRPPNAQRVLHQAELAEEQASVMSQIAHRVIRVEQTRVGDPVVLRHKIEIWEDRNNGLRGKRVYDQTNMLIAGEWEDPNGTHTFYHHGSGLKRAERAEIPPDALVTEPWQLELTARQFSAIAGDTELQILENQSHYSITLDGTRTIGSVKLVAATLILAKPELRAVQQTIQFGRDDGIYQYKFTEELAERLNKNQASPEYFIPDSFLSSPSGRPETTGNIALPDRTSGNTVAVTSSASAELEIEVAYLLNRAKSDRNEQISLTRTTTGSLLIEGVVDTEERKREVEVALGPVRKNPLVKIELQTVAKAANHKNRGQPIRVVEPVRETANTIAVDRDLREYFKKTDPALVANGDVDEEVRRFSSQVVNSVYRGLFHAIELKRLKNRFAQVDLQTVSPDARRKCLEMIREHAKAFENEIAILKRSIQPIFFAGAAPAADHETQPISNDAELGRAIERLWRLALANNGAIRDAFTISSQISGGAVRSLPFWQSLNAAEALAAQIRQYE